MRKPLAFVVVFCVMAVGCGDCTEPVGNEGEGEAPGEGEGEVGEGEGEAAEGEGEAAEGEGEGEGEGEEVVDGGNGFDLEGLLDGGLPEELDCLPTELPELSIGGALDALGFTTYTGRREDGVVCGDVTCDDDVPCCALCGFGACAVDIGDAGAPDCPAFTTTYTCDGDEECPGSDICCFTLQGTECRPEADCAFSATDSLSGFFVDGGFSLPDGGPPVDGGFLDGGFAPDTILDGGFGDGGFVVDGGFADGGFADAGEPIDGPPIPGDPITGQPLDGGVLVGLPLDGGPGPQLDGGSVLDSLQETLDQGVPVCRSLFDCDIFSAEICCTSERLTSVDVGFCLPALLCAGDFLP